MALAGKPWRIDNLTELILIMRQDKFGVSSEKTPKDAVDGRTKRTVLIRYLPVRTVKCTVIRLICSVCSADAG